MNVIDIREILEDRNIPDISKYLIETALDIKATNEVPNGFCFLAVKNGGTDHSYSNLNKMDIPELEIFIGKLSIELQRAVFKANCLKYADNSD